MNAPFHTPAQRAEAFRTYLRQLDDRETVELLGWLLDTGVNDPCPDMSEELIDALTPVSEAFSKAYPAIKFALHGDELDQDFTYIERVSPAIYGSAVR